MAKKNISIFTSIEGHYTLALALNQLLSEKYNVSIFAERDNSFNLYLPIYQLFPGALKFPFQLSKKEKVVDILHQYSKAKYQKRLAAFCRKHESDMCINTFWMYNRSLENITAARNIPLINLLTDPRTVHPVIIAEKAAANLIFDEQQAGFCREFFPDANYLQTGWLVRQEYEVPYNKIAIREELKLEKDVFTILLASGSEGTNIITKILPALITTTTPLQIIVACGTNKTLFRTIQTLARLALRVNKRHTLLPIPFTTKLQLYMQAADIVMGKAGPNSIFEAVATKTPFFAITHIAGQEDGNLDIIREHNLGYVEENTSKAANLLKKIIQHPQELEKFQPSLEKMATYNQGSKQKILDLVESLLRD